MSTTPKTLHLYWGRNKPLSFMRWMTACSFAMQNPDWQIQVYSPETPCTAIPWETGEQGSAHPSDVDWFPQLEMIPNVTASVFDFRPMRLPADVPEVIRSDLLRWYLLWREGGAWADFDILWIRDIGKIIDGTSDLYLCEERPVRVRSRAFRVRTLYGKRYQAIGFMAGMRGRRLWLRTLEAARDGYDRTAYQSAGRFALERALGESEQEPRYYPPSLVYPFSAQQIPRLYDNQGEPRTPFIGIHWFAGDPLSARHEAATTPETLEAQPGFLFEHMKHAWKAAREVRCKL